MFDGIVATIVAGLFGIFTWWLSVRHERRKQNPGVAREINPGVRIRSGKRNAIIVALALVSLLTVSALYFFVQRPGNTTDTAEKGKIAVAVLPFTNMSAEREQEYFSDGLSEELLNVLAKNPKLKVTSRTSAFSFKGKDVDIKTIAEKLNVTHVVEGSVRKAGSDLRITAQLIETGSDSHLWSETYDRPMQNIFAIQQDIASAISKALKVTLEGKDAAQPKNTTPEAYNAYLMGRHLSQRQSKEELQKAVQYLEEAIRIDPEYAPAWASLAGVRSFQAAVGLIPEDAGYAKARQEAERAIELDPQLGHGYMVRGGIQSEYDWNWSAADASYRKARELAPGDAEIMLSAASLAHAFGRMEEAIGLVRASLERNPLNESGYAYLGWMLFNSNRLLEAESSFRKAIELYGPGNHYDHMLGQILLAQGKQEEALEAVMKSPHPIYKTLGQALVYHAMRKANEADAALSELIKIGQDEWAYQVAEVYAYRGDIDTSFQWLERAYKQRDGALLSVKMDPLLRNLHPDPRWPAFLRKMKLPID